MCVCVCVCVCVCLLDVGNINLEKWFPPMLLLSINDGDGADCFNDDRDNCSDNDD